MITARRTLRLLGMGSCIAIGLTACAEVSTDTVLIDFAVHWRGGVSNCIDATTAIATPQVRNLRFYVSDPAMIDASGRETPLSLLGNAAWQHRQLALIALAVPGNACSAGADGSLNHRLVGHVAPGNYVGLVFTLGVPFDLNHQNTMTASAPLNTPSMFWTWQLGYKFLRLDIDDEWSFHLGSAGCVSSSAVRPPDTPCGQPNRARIRLDIEPAGARTVVFDLDALLADIDIHRVDDCTGRFAGQPVCKALLERVGLIPVEGQCADRCKGQTLFRIEQ